MPTATITDLNALLQLINIDKNNIGYPIAETYINVSELQIDTSTGVLLSAPNFKIYQNQVIDNSIPGTADPMQIFNVINTRAEALGTLGNYTISYEAIDY
jgi:hypothetical protein